MISKKINPLLILIPLFLFWRIVCILLFHPTFQFHDPAEELYRGALGKALLEGFAHHPFGYAIENYSVLAFTLFGYLASFLFRLFGDHAFSLKLIPLAFSCLTLAFWCLTLKKFARERTATLFGILFILCPQSFVTQSLLTMAGHAESMLFTAISLFLFLRLLSGENMRRDGICLGLFAGLGMSFAYIYGVTLISILLFWLWKDRKLFQKSYFYLCAAFFVLGFSPWVILQLLSGGAGIQVYDLPVWGFFELEFFTRALQNFRHLVIFQFFHSFFTRDLTEIMLYKLLNGSYGVLFLVAFACLFFLRKKSKDELLPFCAFFLLIYFTISQFSFFRGLRFLIPTYPFFFALMALALARLEEQSKWGALLRSVLLGGWIGLGLLSTSLIMSPKHAGQIFRTKGYNFASLTYHPVFSAFSFCKKTDDCLKHYPFFEKHISKEDFFDASALLAIRLTQKIRMTQLREDVHGLRSRLPKSLEPFFYFYLGQTLTEEEGNLGDWLEKIHFLKEKSPELYRLTAIGLIRNFKTPVTKEYLSNLDLQALPHATRHWEFAQGYHFIRRLIQENALLDQLDDHLKSKENSAFLRGAGQALTEHFLFMAQKPVWHLGSLESLSAAQQKWLFQGVGMSTVSEEFFDHTTVIESILRPEVNPKQWNWIKEGQQMLYNFIKLPNASP